MSRFYYGSVVNCINVSGKTVEEVEEQMSSELQVYTLTLKERGGKEEKIRAADIGLKYSSDEEVKNLKEGQNPLKWIDAFFDTKDSVITVGFSYDEKLLREQLDKLTCFDSSNIIEPKNPTFKYTDNGYVVIDEVYGNKVNKDMLYDCVANAISNKETALDLESGNCYVNPKYTSKSPEVFEIKNKLDKYVSSKITYTIGDKKEIVDCSIINKWLSVDENLVFKFDEEKVKEYINILSKTYNTVGKARSFVTSAGKTINISGGDYGWLINFDKEAQELIAAIKQGQTIVKQPACIQIAKAHGSNDIGNSFVEIDLARQHLWFYKNGSLVVQGDIVSGTLKTKYATPAGVYKLKYKKRNAVLVGPDYRCPVAFWMPFNGGIGIHDATWRGRFGGSINRYNGSHGCINASYSLAKTIFASIDSGTAVVCYY